MLLRRVPVPRQDEMLGPEAAREHVADGVERGMVAARDDEHRERRRGERIEWDVRLPRPALDDQRPRALLELRAGAGKGGRRRTRPWRRKPRRNASGSSVGPVAHHSIPPRTNASTAGFPSRDARRRRLDHRQRADGGRHQRGGEQRDHAAVGVTDEVGAVADRVGHEDGVLLEVDVVDGWTRRESGPLEDLELEAVAERPLTAPRRAAAHDAAVHEDDPTPCASSVQLRNKCDECSRFWLNQRKSTVTSCLIRWRRNGRPTPTNPHSLATASGLLLGTIGAAMAVGAVVGWALGGAGLGLLVGAVIGIPLAVFVV